MRSGTKSWLGQLGWARRAFSPSSLASASVCLAAVLVVSSIGCGSKNSATASKDKDQEAVEEAEPAPVKIADTETADKAVRQFLAAFKAGDDKKAEGMLTATARKKTKEAGLEVAPRGSDTAEFKIAEPVYLDQNGDTIQDFNTAVGARVETVCSDIVPDGKNQKRREDTVTWMLRKETEGWRIAGMAAVVIPGRDPLLLNFEDPAESQAKIEKLKLEIAKEMREAETAQQAANGQDAQPTGNQATQTAAKEQSTQSANSQNAAGEPPQQSPSQAGNDVNSLRR